MRKSSVCIALLLLQSLSTSLRVHALEGDLVINGFMVPKPWISAYTELSEQYPALELCPVKDDAHVIEKMARYILPILEAQRLGMDIAESKKQSLDAILDKTDLPSYALNKHLQYLRDKSGYYQSLLHTRITDEQVAKEFDRRVREKHHSVTNVYVFKADYYHMLTKSDADGIVRNVLAGQDLRQAAKTTLGEKFEDDFLSLVSDTSRWLNSADIVPLTPEASEFAIGDVWVEGRGNKRIVGVVKEMNFIPILEADKKYDWHYATAIERIRLNMELDRHIALYRKLREQADVRINGEKVGLPNFDEIHKHGLHRKGTVLSHCIGGM